MGVPNLALLLVRLIFLRNHFVFVAAFPDDLDFTFSLHRSNRIALQGFAHPVHLFAHRGRWSDCVSNAVWRFPNVEHAFTLHPDIDRPSVLRLLNRPSRLGTVFAWGLRAWSKKANFQSKQVFA